MTISASDRIAVLEIVQRWAALAAWAQNQSTGIDLLPPSSMTTIVTSRWPGEPDHNNSVSADSNTKR